MKPSRTSKSLPHLVLQILTILLLLRERSLMFKLLV
ncbi:hypothetical protein AZE42_13929 [Rhizopogon vesiculosus]|uniref:Uncharacterized protein n=1 Tax=Rhizopogon vesiculosus TaxID=180088 RepID=A0A1J8QGW3_9AGAM|nr:hypothetical protein AZE42_13929 [Rhizopogon vesiculosus]